MKRIFILMGLIGLLTSCSSDEGTDSPGEDRTDYFPVTTTSRWNYNYVNQNQQNNISGEFIANLEGEVNFNGEIYQVLDNTTYLLGAGNMIFFQKSLDKEITLRPIVEVLGISLDFENIPFIKNVMSPGQQTGAATLQITGEPIPIPGDSGLNGTITTITQVSLQSDHINKMNNMTVGQHSYNNICHNRMNFRITIDFEMDATLNAGGQTIPVQTTHRLVDPVEYGHVDVWLAEDTGIVKTDYSYSFQDIDLNTTVTVGGITIDLLDLAPELLNFNSSLDNHGNAALLTYTP